MKAYQVGASTDPEDWGIYGTFTTYGKALDALAELIRELEARGYVLESIHGDGTSESHQVYFEKTDWVQAWLQPIELDVLEPIAHMIKDPR